MGVFCDVAPFLKFRTPNQHLTTFEVDWLGQVPSGKPGLAPSLQTISSEVLNQFLPFQKFVVLRRAP